MYNRYIPQPDGSYRRNRIQEPLHTPEKQLPAPPPVPTVSKDPPSVPCSTCMHNPQPRRPMPRREPQRKDSSIGGFLKQLLPRDFETEDLLVVLLLLLISGDCQDNQNTALLTLALYLFL